MSYFRERRCLELSTLAHFTTQVASAWSGVTLVKSFQKAYKASLPVIAIGLENNTPRRREIGNNSSLINDYNMIFDIFATSDGQRLDLAQYMLDIIKLGWVYNTYTQTAGVLTATVAGRAQVIKFVDDRKLNFGVDVDKYDKFRHVIEVTVRVGLT